MLFNDVDAWAEKYVGIPYAPRGRDFDGVDCWGLCYLIWKNEFGIVVPLYDDVSYTRAGDSVEIAKKVEEEAAKAWAEVPINQAVRGDCLLVRMRGYPMHIAMVIKPGAMLHALEGVGSHVSVYYNFEWNKRILKAYRHASR